MSCGIFGKLQVAVDHEGCEEKRQINDRGDEKALGRSVAVLAESEIKRSEHDEKSQCDRTEKIEVSGRFVSFPQIEKVGCKDQKVKDESVEQTLRRAECRLDHRNDEVENHLFHNLPENSTRWP